MTDTILQEKSIEAMITMNAAITNLRLYPSTSAMIVNNIERAYQSFMAILEMEDSVVFAEAERNILVGGVPFSQKDQGRPQVAAFLELMLNFEIKSVTFERGVEREELTTFLEIMSKKPEDVKKEGGLQHMGKQLRHIITDQKFYIATDSNHQILAGLDIKDEDIITYMMDDDPEVQMDLESVKEKAKDPEWISRIFQSGIKNINDQKGDVPSMQLAENLIPMLDFLNKVADNVDKEKISQRIAGSIADMDADFIGAFLTQHMEDLLDGNLMNNIVTLMDNDKFEKVADMIRDMGNSAASVEGDELPDREIVTKVYENMMDSEKGQRYQIEVRERDARQAEAEGKKAAVLAVINRIITGDEAVFLNEELMHSIPDIVGELFAREENRTADAIIDKLSDALLGKNQESRVRISQALSRIFARLSPEQYTDTVGRVSDRLARWIRLENLATPEYEQMCIHLKNLVQTFIRNHKFAESNPVLDVFSRIYSGAVEKNDSIQEIVNSVMDELALEELQDIIFDEFETNKEGKQTEAGSSLSKLGATPVSRLFDILRDSEDSTQRVRILNLLTDIGSPALPVLIEKIQEDEPWYYIRNLARVMGKIGTEDQAKILEPLLFHKDFRVQQESLRSIYTIGGNLRGEILLSALPNADNQLKVQIVTVLGTLKMIEAVGPLIELLKSKSFITTEQRVEIDEKICTALGNIGAPEALPVLTEISKPKLFRMKSYPEKVKIAAGKAIVQIKRKQASSP